MRGEGKKAERFDWQLMTQKRGILAPVLSERKERKVS